MRLAGSVADPTEKERLDVVEPKVVVLEKTVAVLVAELDRVSNRLRVLEMRLSGAGSGDNEDFDALDEDVADIVEALRRAWDAEQEVLADSVRVQVRKEVAEFDGLKTRREASKAKIAAGRLTRADHMRLVHDVDQLDWQIGAQGGSARDAAARLAADERAAEEAWRQDAIIAGEKAREEIWAAARARIDRALAEDTRLPVWFRIGLGEITNPDPAPWLLAATGLVAYRLEYGVTDPVRPLGPIPSAESGSAAWVRRTEVYGDVSEQLKGLRP
ncbi:hypothetical protein CLV43_112262 [Umezawaea tangerina]|uniref:Uncharacterized protein n=1 Tax=Umezawaea tangerina TaxID=84725 RepID=A0A2T0SSE9_9PSEU|nr:hypothetical protein CLV43_112262 [Umezawaea tangerina]